MPYEIHEEPRYKKKGRGTKGLSTKKNGIAENAKKCLP
jgi:hypothetical protein